MAHLIHSRNIPRSACLGLALWISLAAPIWGDDGDAALLAVRDHARQWLSALPDVVCLQTTEHFVSNGWLLWRRDLLSQAELTIEGGVERYRTLSVDGKPVGAASSNATQIEGSSGEYLSAVRRLFDPASRAEFRIRGSHVEHGRTLIRYEFRIQQENSQWYVGMDPGFRPAYSGILWVDSVGGGIARIEMDADSFPAKVGIRLATLQTTFERVAIDGAVLELPTRSEVIVRMNGGYAERRVLRYTAYRRFAATSRVVDGDAK